VGYVGMNHRNNFAGMVCGFCIVKENGDEATEDEAKVIYKEKNNLRDHIKNKNQTLKIGNTDKTWWLLNNNMPCYKWSKEELLADLAEESTIMKTCKDKIKELLSLIEDYKPS
jgi:outer membrane lipoprotein-sorting protein